MYYICYSTHQGCYSNPPHSWTDTVGPYLPGFTMAPCVDSIILRMLLGESCDNWHPYTYGLFCLAEAPPTSS
jgi:hypothetical protein